MNPFPQAQDMKDLTRTPADVYTLLRINTLQAIYAAAESNLTNQLSVTTDAITYGSGATAQQRQQIQAELQQQGFAVTPGETTFTVTWQR